MEMVSIIVMEPGSEWPGHVAWSENIVELGEHEEPLLPRIRSRLDALRLEGARVRVAVLACNEAADAASAARREELAHELLAGVAALGFGRLVLNAAAHASAQLRIELLSLAGSLSHSCAGAAVVSVKFGEPDAGRSLQRGRRASRPALDRSAGGAAGGEDETLSRAQEGAQIDGLEHERGAVARRGRANGR